MVSRARGDEIIGGVRDDHSQIRCWVHSVHMELHAGVLRLASARCRADVSCCAWHARVLTPIR